MSQGPVVSGVKRGPQQHLPAGKRRRVRVKQLFVCLSIGIPIKFVSTLKNVRVKREELCLP